MRKFFVGYFLTQTTQRHTGEIANDEFRFRFCSFYVLRLAQTPPEQENMYFFVVIRFWDSPLQYTVLNHITLRVVYAPPAAGVGVWVCEARHPPVGHTIFIIGIPGNTKYDTHHPSTG